MDKPQVRRIVAQLRCGEGLRSSATPRRSYYSQHGSFCVFVLVFYFSEDLYIGLMRTL